MSISQARYVDITSGQGAGSAVAQRNLGTLIVSINPLIPVGHVISFTSAADVGDYFGTGSGEYERAQFYFSFISKNITAPGTLSFWFWNDDVATGSLLFGAAPIDTLSQFNAITTGDFTLTMGGLTEHVTAINLSGAASLAAVAADIQTAIRAVSAGGTAFTGATVTYDATSGAFNLASGTTGSADIIGISAGVTTDLAGPLGWLSPSAILSNGSAAQTLTANLNALVDITNNFGSFCLGADSTITLPNITAAAEWNYSLTPNNQFLFTWAVTPTNASTWRAAVAGIGGQAGHVKSPVTGEFSEMDPMCIFASTDYTRPNSVNNYMYYEFDQTASVTTNALADTYDALRLNYVGQTQQAGNNISFYQRGFITGGQETDPSDINTYCNEIWFKDAIGSALLNLLLSLSKVSANNAGRAQLLNTIQSVINLAIFNGTVSVGKTLSTVEQLFISQVTNDPNAWRQVQNIGYWVNVVIQSYVQDGVTQYKAVYTLVYSKDDDIRLIQGSDILI